MEYKILCLMMLAWASLSLCSGQNNYDPVTVKILGTTRFTKKPGQAMRLTCQVNRGLPVILTHTIQWVHVALYNHSHPSETILTTQQGLAENVSASDYAIEVEYNDNMCNFTLDVKSLKPTDDGHFTCRVFNNENEDQMKQWEAFVIVVNDVESVALQFDGEQPITGQANDSIQREEGRYGVTCTAYGFNPYASINVFLGDKQLETGDTELWWDDQRSARAKARRFQAVATAPKVELKANNYLGQLLRCVARADFDGAREVVTSVPLMVISYDVESVALQFDGEQPITGKANDSIQREEGRYGVTCTTYSFSPNASIDIFLGDEQLETGGTENMRDDQRSAMAKAQRYKAVATAPKVELKTIDSGRLLRCVARAGFDGAREVVTSVPLKVMALGPVIPDSSPKTTTTFFLCGLSVLLSLLRLW